MSTLDTKQSPFLLRLLFVIFFCSGFAGLIYESIWTHYLKLFLGHAAYAQTLVLSIFMLGMAIGSWLAGRMTLKTRKLFLIYAAVELALGLFAIFFHDVSRAVTQYFFSELAPHISTPAGVHLVKWSLAALLIVPQSILIGMTFPLIATGLLHIKPDDTGRTLSLLYFTNSIGASIGVLASGFVLISWVGLPGTTMLSGAINILIALSMFVLFYRRTVNIAAPAPASKVTWNQRVVVLFTIATFTGLASFVYEIVWIRLLSLVLGSATHAFELMLSSFILGLALGGFLIRNYIDRFVNPFRALAIIQIAMGVAAVASLLFYQNSFVFMSMAKSMLAKTPEGYIGFNLASHAICLIVMLPTTILAGMTLPIIIKLLLKEAGDQSVGNAYAFNTLGAILGVLLTVHILLPNLGVKNSLLVGAGIDIALGLLLLASTQAYRSKFGFALLSMSTLVFFAVLFPQKLDQKMLTSGVFRHGMVQFGGDVTYYQDGKTATVSVTNYGEKLSLATNGKPDASIYIDERISGDEMTQMLLGTIPVLLAPDKNQVAVIGFGSGMSTHAALASEQVKRVDTIEIEPAMYEGARHFYKKSFRAFDDPRSHVIFEDAKTYFATSGNKYGLIIAEPSNPWVSGVSSLFADEFYHHIKAYLQPQGVFAQWVQTYELSPELLVSISNALGKNFKYYDIYYTAVNDIVLVASDTPLTNLADLPALSATVKTMLAPLHIQSIQDLSVLKIASKAQIDPALKRISTAINSDYYPIVDQQAVKSRYLDHDAMGLNQLLNPDLPVKGTLLDAWPQMEMALRNAKFSQRLLDTQNFYQNTLHAQALPFENKDLKLFELTFLHCDLTAQDIFWPASAETFQKLSGFLRPEQFKNLWSVLSKHACLQPELYQHKPVQQQAIKLFEALANQRYAELQNISAALLNDTQKQTIFSERYLKQLWLFSAVMAKDRRSNPPFELNSSLDQDQNNNWLTNLLLSQYLVN